MKSKLNGGNLVHGDIQKHLLVGGKMNCRLNCIDRKTRKLFTIYGALHHKSNVDRLYIPRKEGGRGLISIEDCVGLAITGLKVHVHGREERSIQTATGAR